MGDITSTSVFEQSVPNLANKIITVKTVTTADNGDTIAVDLDKYGIKNVLGVLTFIHATDLSVMTLETTDASTTAVSSRTLTLTIAGSTSNKRRVHVIFGE